MRTYKHQSELIAHHDEMLGKCVRVFQQLEGIVQMRALQLGLASSDTVRDAGRFAGIAVAELSFAASVRLLATLLAQLLPMREEYKQALSNPQTKIKLLAEIERATLAIKKIHTIEEQRNRYVHSHWFVMGTPPDSTDLIPPMRARQRASPKKLGELEEFSSETFPALIAEIEAVTIEIGGSCGRLLGLLDYDEGKKNRRSRTLGIR